MFRILAIVALVGASFIPVFTISAEAAPPCKVAGSSFEYMGGPNHKTLEFGEAKDFFAGGLVTNAFINGIQKLNAMLIKDYQARGDLSYSERGISHDPSERTEWIVSKVLADLGCK